MNPRSRIARLRAAAKARKDPLNRAVPAPRVTVPPVSCPIGRCEHLAGHHDLVQAGSDEYGWPVQGAKCTAEGCTCEGALE